MDLYNTGNYSFPQLSSEYGVAKSTILSWVRSLSPIQVSETETVTMKELEIENEILKKATAIFEYIETCYNTVRIHSLQDINLL